MARSLAELETEALGCTRCPLAGTRNSVVFGSGDPRAQLVLVGEAPGQSEDAQGVPFVGAAGGLLTELLSGIGLRRSEVYIANVLKCRPPGNRDPVPAEVETCRPFLEGQLAAIGPRVVVALGNFAARLLLGTREGITRLRGREYPFPPWLESVLEQAEGHRPGTGVLIPTFHPAAVLRGRGEALAQMRADFVLAKRALRRSPAEAGPDAQPRVGHG